MEPSGRSCRLPWVLASVLALLLIVLVGERLFRGFTFRIMVESAVHHSSDIAARMTATWHTEGKWPPPGEMQNRGLVFVESTSQHDGRRVDRYTGIPGGVVFMLDDDGSMLVFHQPSEAN